MYVVVTLLVSIVVCFLSTDTESTKKLLSVLKIFWHYISFFAVLGFELRAYTLSHPPTLSCEGFFRDSVS
jgi:hypothetical protein